MKKIPLALPLLSFALVFAGCGKKDAAEPTLAEKTEAAAKDAAEKTKDMAVKVADKTKEVAIDAKDAIHDKLVDWKLMPSDLKADFEKGGRIVRSKAATAGARTGEVFDNARIVTVINGKLLADSRLSAIKINVDADQGVVTLKGTVQSVDLIGRAMGLALDTEGVNQVVSLLTVETK
jgi:hyperosmotically inducible protein